MNPNPGSILKKFAQGKAVSAGTLNAMHKAAFEVSGRNGIYARWENGRLVVEGQPAPATLHPFEIVATVEPELGVEIIVSVANGSIDYRSPLFKGSTGDPISDDPAPTYQFAPSAGVYRVYLVVTVDKNGVLADDQDVWIDIPDVVNDPLPTNTEPVPDDMPLPGNTGTAGLVHIQIGYITVAVTGDVITVSTWNDIRENFTFWYCDGGYFIRPIS